MTQELVALLDGREVGRVRRERTGRLHFAYHDRWRTARGAYPLSLSMPLAAAERGHAVIESYLGDSCRTIQRSSSAGRAASTFRPGTPSR